MSYSDTIYLLFDTMILKSTTLLCLGKSDTDTVGDTDTDTDRRKKVTSMTVAATKKLRKQPWRREGNASHNSERQKM